MNLLKLLLIVIFLVNTVHTKAMDHSGEKSISESIYVMRSVKFIYSDDMRERNRYGLIPQEHDDRRDKFYLRPQPVIVKNKDKEKIAAVPEKIDAFKQTQPDK